MVDGEFAPKSTRQPNQKNCLEGVGRNRMQHILTFGGGVTAPMTLWPSCKTNYLIFRAATCHKQHSTPQITSSHPANTGFLGRQVSHEKDILSLKGILATVHYNPLYTLNLRDFFHCSGQWMNSKFKHLGRCVFSMLVVWSRSSTRILWPQTSQTFTLQTSKWPFLV